MASRFVCLLIFGFFCGDLAPSLISPSSFSRSSSSWKACGHPQSQLSAWAKTEMPLSYFQQVSVDKTICTLSSRHSQRIIIIGKCAQLPKKAASYKIRILVGTLPEEKHAITSKTICKVHIQRYTYSLNSAIPWSCLTQDFTHMHTYSVFLFLKEGTVHYIFDAHITEYWTDINVRSQPLFLSSFQAELVHFHPPYVCLRSRQSYD